jgi:adenine-specific DNA-methyltransferase
MHTLTGNDAATLTLNDRQHPNADSDDAVYVNSEDGGRHTKWLNYMGPRLYLVWELLDDHGVCFVSINDIELFRVGMLMDEIFGERNRLGVLVWKGANREQPNPHRPGTRVHPLLCQAGGDGPPDLAGRECRQAVARRHVCSPAAGASRRSAFSPPAPIRAHQEARKLELAEKGESDLVDLGRAARYKFVDARGIYAAEDHTDKPSGGYHYDVPHPATGKPCKRPASGYRFKEETMYRLLAEDRIVFRKDHTLQLQVKKYLSEVAGSYSASVKRHNWNK